MNPLFFRALLAALPLLGLALETKASFVGSGAVFGTLLLAPPLFFILSFVIPEILQRISFLLLLWILLLLFSKFIPVSPLLFVSLAVLTPPELFHSEKNWRVITQKSLQGGFLFGAIFIGHGLLSEELGLRAGMRVFQTPVGSYWFLGLALYLLVRKEKL